MIAVLRRISPATKPPLVPILCLCLLLGGLDWTAQGANGVVYYNRITSPTSPATIRRVGGDGDGDQAVPVNLPSPIYPTMSRNGRFLLMTSTDPGRPFKISNNVYLADLLTGALGRVTTYDDEFVSGGVRFNDDLAKFFGDPTISRYSVNFPYHKALSPDGTRTVVMNLWKAASVMLGAGPQGPDVIASSGRFPKVDIFNVTDALPAGAYVYLSPQVRDGLNQGGDGLDWHPTLNEVVATVGSDIPAVGNAGITSMQGTLLAVFSTTTIPSFIRILGNPTGQVDILGGNLFYFGVHDYAPAISPDGQRVAYVRHVLRQGIQSGYAPFPAQCSIRIINYNGTDDQAVLTLADGFWITKVSWSPDSTQIAFDLSPQMVLNGQYSLLGDVSQSQIHVVNANPANANPHQLVAGVAAYPSWGRDLAARPSLQITRNGNGLRIRVDDLTPGQSFTVEVSPDLQTWAPLSNDQATGTSALIEITPDVQTPVAFYRIAT